MLTSVGAVSRNRSQQPADADEKDSRINLRRYVARNALVFVRGVHQKARSRVCGVGHFLNGLDVLPSFAQMIHSVHTRGRSSMGERAGRRHANWRRVVLRGCVFGGLGGGLEGDVESRVGQPQTPGDRPGSLVGCLCVFSVSHTRSRQITPARDEVSQTMGEMKIVNAMPPTV